MPKVIGAARRYELTGERRYRDIAEYFWHQVAEERWYCIGNSSNGELWDRRLTCSPRNCHRRPPSAAARKNMLKLTRQLFSWTGDAKCADYYERALFNCRLGTQHPDDGRLMYSFPLASGYWKLSQDRRSTPSGVARAGRRGIRKARRQHLLPYGLQPHRQPVRRVGAALDREGRTRAAGHALPSGRSHPSDRGRESAVSVHAAIARAVLGGWRQRLDQRHAHPRVLIAIELSLADADVEEWRCRRADAADAAAPLAHARRPQRPGSDVRAVGAGWPLGSEGLTEAMQLGDYDQDYKGTVAQVDPIHAPIEGDPAWVEPVKGRALTFTTVNPGARDRARARQRDSRREVRRLLAANAGLEHRQLPTPNFQLPTTTRRAVP